MGNTRSSFREENRVYLTWSGLSHDLSQLQSKQKLRELLEEIYPKAPKGRISNNAGQIWAFAKGMELGDWVVLPSKHKPAIHIAEVTGPYTFLPDGPDPFFHCRAVKWIAEDIPRSNFDQDILYSFGAFMTVCQISRNDAELRVKAMAKSGWKPAGIPAPVVDSEGSEDASEEGPPDLAQAARDQIAKLIIARFMGHGLARLVDAVLRAQGYATHLSPEGPDKGVDILAAPGPMGFAEPKICIQVKSGDSPLDRPTLDQLIGVMQNVQATNGLLVSWGGFKSSVDKETAAQFFRVRLWDQDDVIDQVLAHYDKLDEEIQIELPLRRIWVVSRADD